MKKNAVILSVSCLLLIFYTSCNLKTKTDIKFDADFTSTCSVTQTDSINVTRTFESQEITTNIATLVSNHGTTNGLIKSCKPTKVNIHIVNSTVNFGSLSDCDVILVKSDGTEKKIGKKHGISTTAQELDCDLEDTDVKEILTQDKMKVKITTVNSQVITQTFTVEIRMSFHFEASSEGG